MEQLSVVDHKVAPNRVTKFLVQQTIVKEKEMTYKTLSKTLDGNKAYTSYVDSVSSGRKRYRNQKYFKLCNKSKKDHEKCKNIPRKEESHAKKTKSFQSMDKQSFQKITSSKTPKTGKPTIYFKSKFSFSIK